MIRSCLTFFDACYRNRARITFAVSEPDFQLCKTMYRRDTEKFRRDTEVCLNALSNATET